MNKKVRENHYIMVRVVGTDDELKEVRDNIENMEVVRNSERIFYHLGYWDIYSLLEDAQERNEVRLTDQQIDKITIQCINHLKDKFAIRGVTEALESDMEWFIGELLPEEVSKQLESEGKCFI